MSDERLDGRDKAILLMWILAGLLGAGVAYKYFFRAFPEASVQFKVPRAAALAEAREFASSQGANLDGYQSSIIFDVDDTAKTYLEREVGLEQANRMMADGVRVWFWQARFFRPLQKEEFDVRVDPGSGITGYQHVLEDTATGASLERPAALAAAESFLRDTLHVDLSRYDFREQEANFVERPSRRDWSFTWELRGFRAKDAPYLLRVALAGDRVSGYQEFLQVPEAWQLDYERIRSSNNLFEFIALIPYAFLFGGCLYVIFSLGRRGLLEWHGSLVLGGVLAALYFVMTMNQWPIERAGYDTNTPYLNFFLTQVGTAVLVSIFSALVVVLAVAPGEPLYRVAKPEKIRLGAGVTLPGIRTKQFFNAGVIGICLAAIHIGYITVFYIVSGKLGAWAPQDLNYTNGVSTSLPWVEGLVTGIYAATSEEFLFRLFAIPFLLRITKSRVLAVVLPAFAWGFLHSNYPQEPAYIRGIEVGMFGIVAGFVMLRWGIWATLIWHYTVDAFLISTSLMRSNGAYLRVSGTIVGAGALIPLAIAGFYYLYRGYFEDDAPLLNSASPLVVSQEVAAHHVVTEQELETAVEDVLEGHAQTTGGAANSQRYIAMSSRTLTILVACGMIGLALLAGVHHEQIGDFVSFSIDRNQATSLADQVLRSNKIDPGSYHHAATIAYTFDGYANEYLRRTIGIHAANAIYRDRVPSAFWTIRYFRDAQNEEYMVVLRTDGALHSLHHTLDERTPGASLTDEEARARAESYLRDDKKLDLSSWKLVGTNADKKPARVDHTFEWEQKAPLNPETSQNPGAHIRIQLLVQGSEVSNYRTFIKIPEAWRDAESRATAPQIVRTFGRAALLSVVIITVLVVFFRSLKHSEIAWVPWRRLGKWSAWVLLAAIVTYANRAPQLLSAYTTTSPLSTYYVTLAISLIFITALYLSAAFLLLGLSWFFLERSFGRTQLPGWAGMPAAYYRDAFYVSIFGTAALLGLGRISVLFARWPLVQHTLDAAVPEGLDALNPAASAVASAVSGSFFAVGIIALVAGLIAMYVRSRPMRLGLAIVTAALLVTDVATPGSFFREAALRLLTIAVLWIGVTRIVRFNLLGYFLLATMVSLAPAVSDLHDQPNAFFHANEYAILMIALALLAWPLVLWRRSDTAGAASH